MVAPQAQVLQVNPTETSEHNGIVVVPAEARFSSHLCNRVLKRKFKSLCGCCTTLLRGKNKPFSSLFLFFPERAKDVQKRRFLRGTISPVASEKVPENHTKEDHPTFPVGKRCLLQRHCHPVQRQLGRWQLFQIKVQLNWAMPCPLCFLLSEPQQK
jgi:hypothetical protein